MSREAQTPRVRRTAKEARRVILDAAEKRLRDGGPEAIRLQDIAADVGVSHPAILHHFESRAGLARALQERSMARLEEDVLAAITNPDESSTTAAILDRVFATLGDSGHARLLAWHVLANQPGDAGDPGEDMLHELTGAVHARRVVYAAETGGEPPPREDSEFIVRLAAVALLGDALCGRILDRSFAHRDGEQVQRRFRVWLADLIGEHLGVADDD